ncbi:MAG: beta-ketoacyl synthase [Pseudohongiellaceae bacterium]
MTRLPVIASIGGISAAGRSSGHQAYRRLVLDRLPADTVAATHQALAALTNRPEAEAGELEAGTLIRGLEDGGLVPAQLSRRGLVVSSAGQLPAGFDAGGLYDARSHPRGLQMTVFAASDAINALGVGWEQIRQRVAPDEIGVYAGSGLGQLDYNGLGGLLQAQLLGGKVTSKQLALGYAEMPADFVNAYLLGNLGTTGTSVAACATFLYNLRQGVRDIQTGSHRLVIVGTSEAPLVPEVFDGFATMGALADDEGLRQLDGLGAGELPDLRRACRPFGVNAGFTLAESAQFVVLMDDELALELGVDILGAVNEVFVNADGFKKSIASPGVGNYISMAKAAVATRNVVGEVGLRERSYVHSHGTGTPQNRTTESHIISATARSFGIDAWPVAAVKAYLGHSLATSAGDQLMAALGAWAYGVIPGIATVDVVADDVSQGNLEFLLEHREFEVGGMDAVIINSKGFGGNNASASVLAPHVVEGMLGRRYGGRRMGVYRDKRVGTLERIAEYEADMCAGRNRTLYEFDNDVLGGGDIVQDKSTMKIKGIEPVINLDIKNSYEDMC